MLRALSLTRNYLSKDISSITKYTPFITNRKSLHNNMFRFSNDKQPRNKEEAWMMQQQKNLGQAPGQAQQDFKQYSGVSRTGFIGFVLLAGSLFYFIYSTKKQGEKNLDFLETDISGLAEEKERESVVGGDWTLIDTQGQPMSSGMLSGYYYLIYFGFTNCPDICPSTLFYLSSMYRIIRNLPEGAYAKLKIVFVSLDPQRDRPEVVKKYLQNFGKQIIGVTSAGPNDIELRECLKRFKIAYKKVPLQRSIKANDYTIDHTTRVFLMDPQNKYLYHLDPTLTEQQNAKAIVAKIVQNQHRAEKKEASLSQ